jgi:malate synthase
MSAEPSPPSGVEIRGRIVAGAGEVLTADALAFVADLTRRFRETRETLLADRRQRQQGFDGGKRPDFLPHTSAIRSAAWTVAPTPRDLEDRRVEITGPVDAKMMINALNSGAQVFMADFEDALSPPWANVVDGQLNCMAAVRHALSYDSPEGKHYRLGESTATLVVRPRGWHLDEPHLLVDGRPSPASLCDFGLYFYHNARELIARGSGPYFYLPKLESHLEARLWNEVFDVAQDAVGLPRGTIRATVLIETILAAFEMDEILYELRTHAAGLNAGRWDYLFSVIKKFGRHPSFVLPDRAQLTMTVPFMRAYTELLVKTCHRRGAHAIGGMAAFIPNRRDAEVNTRALQRVRDDKAREAAAGYDGGWVAHPDLVATVRATFDEVLAGRPNQRDRQRDDVRVTQSDLLTVRVDGGRVTDAGVRTNVRIALRYLESWLGGQGAVAIDNLMEDTATAEISRAQLWQWIHHGTPTEDGSPVTLERVRTCLREISAELRNQGPPLPRLQEATTLLEELFAAGDFVEFLTLPAYQRLVADERV